MDVPLAAERTLHDDEQRLRIWTQGAPRTEQPPLRPYCYTKRPFTHGVHDQTETRARPLSTLDPQDWIKARFPTVDALARTAHRRPESELAEAHLPFVERVLLDAPDYYRRFPNGPPTRLTLDIEQRTDGSFPTPEDPILSIAWALDDEPPTSHQAPPADEADLLQAFLDVLRQHDPDLLIGYNHTRYDLPRLVHRLEHHELPTTPLTREEGRIEDARYTDGVRLVGRVAYDAYDAVRADQTLSGIKDHKLPTVADWHGLDYLAEDVDATAQLPPDRLARYNENDVHVTRAIADPYLANEIQLAEFYGAPLQTVTEATASFHCRTLQGRIMVEKGIISDGRNDERYPDLYEQTGGEGFVGGIVELYQRGRFSPVTLVDFASMYPSILVALGAGADNTRHRGTLPPGPYEATRDGDTLTLKVPDPARNLRHAIEIHGRSPLAKQLGELLDYRLELKATAKTSHDATQATSKQGMVKVILNSVYGVMASRHARYASLPVAIATVGTARRLIRRVEDTLGDDKIETDTDGVYAQGHIDPAPIEHHVNRFLQDTLGADPTLRIDADTYQAGYFHEGKNYLLLHEDGRLETHGVAFKGSSRPPIFDEALARVARPLLEGREDVDEIASQALNLSTYDPEDFVMRIRLGKHPDRYEATNHVAAQVARAAQRNGNPVTKGDQVRYVKTTRGYDVARDRAFEALDEEYYRDVLVDLFGRLGIDARAADQRSLAEFI